jgi:hypothetical protein
MSPDKPSNPFSKYLRQFTADPDFERFIEQWDVLESVVVRVYRGKLELAAAQSDFDQAWPWLREVYLHWEPALRPYWQATKAAGETTHVDPFQLLLDLPSPDAIPGNWTAMQHLPAAREAINRFLVDHGHDG